MLANLSELKVGDKFIIRGYKSADRAYRNRLIGMGVIKGKEAYIKRVAPIGDPMEIVIGTISVSLRKSETEVVEVEKLIKL